MKRILSLLLFVVVGCAERIAPTEGSVHGVVKDAQTAEPLGGCAVTLVPSGATTTTGADGAYHFENLAPEQYSVEVAKVGYSANKKSIIVVAGGAMVVDLLLSKVAIKLGITPASHDFGETFSQIQFALSNLAAVGTISYELITENLAPWARLTGEKLGSIQDEQTATITINVERAAMQPATYQTSFKIKSSVGEYTVPLMMSVADPNNRMAVVSIVQSSGITDNSFTMQGKVADPGSTPVTATGFCWAQTPNPTLVADPSVEANAVFSAQIVNLEPETTYYVRAYATNGRGTAYSEQMSVTTTIFTPPPAPTNVAYLATTGNDANDGLSWAKAKKTLDGALKTGKSEIWIAVGQYASTSSLGAKDVKIYGGFDGAETSLRQRPTTQSRTTLLNGSLNATNSTIDRVRFSNCELYCSKNTIVSYCDFIQEGIWCDGEKAATVSYCTFKEIAGYAIQSYQYSFFNVMICNTSFTNVSGLVYFYNNFGKSSAEFYGCLINLSKEQLLLSGSSDVVLKLSNCTVANVLAGLAYRGIVELYNTVLYRVGNPASAAVVSTENCLVSSDNSEIKFVNPSADASADYRVQAGSTLIDGGLNAYFPLSTLTVDLTGSARLKGSRIDIGAYEY